MDCLCLAARSAARSLTAVYESELAASGVTPSQFGLLSVLAARPGLSQQQLAAIADLDQTTLSRNLRLLIASGWVRRTGSKTDRRESLYALTPAGALRRQQARVCWTQAQRRMKKALGAEWETALLLLDRLAHVAAAKAA